MTNFYPDREPIDLALAADTPAARSETPGLHSALQVGAWALAHRVVLAPLNRLLALSPGGVPSPMSLRHYALRASAGGLIVAESIAVAAQGLAQAGTSGIFGPEHVNAWRSVTDEVHRRGGFIVAQLWHGGRLASAVLSGLPAIGPSAVAAAGTVHVPAAQAAPTEAPVVLDDDGIDDVMEQYRRAAENAADAGFDGVEMSCANGCLADQFLHDSSNQRADRYGGPVENRVRFLIDAVQTLCAVWGSARVGVRLSPFSVINDVEDSTAAVLFPQVLLRLQDEHIAYVHLVEPRSGGGLSSASDTPQPLVADWLRASYPGVLIASGGFDGASAQQAIARGSADAIGFGRAFIANPDLPRRLAAGAVLSDLDPAQYFRADEDGTA
ncbi:MAG TPA: alkene reductase [Ideonella sp.]|nr:alkene reductase [Ideonella sp.]